MEISKTENEALGLNHGWTRILQEVTELTEGEQGARKNAEISSQAANNFDYCSAEGCSGCILCAHRVSAVQ
jgi:hypothetical protein